jgi:hypothetical protein
MVVQFRVDVDTDVSPKKILAAFTDFSEKRSEIWKALSKKVYKVHSVGKTSADITEGSDMPGGVVWARETYDWSKKGVVRWTVRESNFCKSGHTMEVIVTPKDSGSHVTLLYDRETYGVKGAIAGVMMQLVGKQMLTKYYQDTFKTL